MLSSLLRPRRERGRIDKSPFSSPFFSSPNDARNQHSRDRGRGRVGDQDRDPGTERDGEEEGEEQDEDEDEEMEPLLPIFSSEHLDKLPLYNITHTVRILIIQKCETTLSWDQLRSPQVSQFLVKPVQSQLRAQHFNRATLCALIANCLQFRKEAETTPGNAGVSRTRAFISELLAMRLIKEFNTRELIDALSYDFDPLQGLMRGNMLITSAQARQHGRGVRISTVEIAIRAQAKHFLAHPLVVQQLEAIWAGNIVFHSAADNLHRRLPKTPAIQDRGYGTLDEPSPNTTPAEIVHPRKMSLPGSIEAMTGRRTVTLYDPRDASLFKLSRLRVPRYRQLFSTLSFAVMLGLFLAVLLDRSLTITPLEVIFWFWSAAYMLDEVVGFSEQGFGLYIMSVWNAFDLGILLLFFVYYVLRLYGILLADDKKHRISHMAYDVLASTAVLLFPRAFSVLDHYRYFSQLLIAFRMMAQDLVAILILIVISCSGFFVAFSVSFSDDDTSSSNVAYALFQILMGFTPAAWEKWAGYNILGKAIMSAFLIICHFLIVTILITVLTNSFMAIVQNANEEHQFLFAVNTISMVKSDALFSYIAPSNILGWLVTPLRYIMPFRQFVKLNRTMIKVTHFPVLFGIFAYERVILSKIAYEPTDLVERRGRRRAQINAFSMAKGPEIFSPGRRMREPSIMSFHKDRALDEVFRQPFKGSTMRTTNPDMAGERRPSVNVVAHWMQEVGEEGGASPPMEQPRSVLERLETRRPTFSRSWTADKSRPFKRDVSSATRSVLSEPDDMKRSINRRPNRIEEEAEIPHETDADGDDELVTNEGGDADEDNLTIGRSPCVPEATPDSDMNAEVDNDKENIPIHEDEQDYFNNPTALRQPVPGAAVPAAVRARLLDTADGPRLLPSKSRRQSQERVVSNTTIVFSPAPSPAASDPAHRKRSRPDTAHHTNSGGTSTPGAAHALSPRKAAKQAPPARARPVMPSRPFGMTSPDLHNFAFTSGRKSERLAIPGSHNSRRPRQPSFNAQALDLASDIGDNRWGPDPDVDGLEGGISGMPASFSERLFRDREVARERERRAEDERKRGEEQEKGMVGRIMLARMNTLEEGFREMLQEVRDLRTIGSSRQGSESGPAGGSGLGNGNGHAGGASQSAFARSRDHHGGRSALNLAASAPTSVHGGGGGGGLGDKSRTSGSRASGEKARRMPRKLQRRSKQSKEMEEGSALASPDVGGSEARPSSKRLSEVVVHEENPQGGRQ